MLTHTINNTDELNDALKENSLRLASSLQALCHQMFQSGIVLGEPAVILKIAEQLVAASYIVNPAMFARTIKPNSVYPQVQAFCRDGFLHIRGGNFRKLLTFKSRARRALLTEQEFIVPRHMIPESYRRRPSILASSLGKEIGVKICNHCKKDTIIWFIPHNPAGHH